MAATAYTTFREILAEGHAREEAVRLLGFRFGYTHPDNLKELDERMRRIERREATPSGAGQSDRPEAA